MRSCTTCRFLIGDNDAGCGFCSGMSPGTALVRVSNTVAVYDGSRRRPPGVATLPVPAHHVYPTPYPRPWNDATTPTREATPPPIGSFAKVARKVRSVSSRRHTGRPTD